MKISDFESVEMYSKNGCPFCVKAKQLLDKHDIAYDEYLVGDSVVKRDIQNRVDSMGITGVTISTVPQIFASVNNDWVYVGGFTELQGLE